MQIFSIFLAKNLHSKKFFTIFAQNFKIHNYGTTTQRQFALHPANRKEWKTNRIVRDEK